MRQLLLNLAALCLFAFPAWAQMEDTSVFQITDVSADVTAASAVKARDQAIVQGQRTAFEQLLGRLGASSAIAAKLSDNDISALVQSFEVQDEHTSAVRYIGTFTVQFRPNAVRSLLGSRNVIYTETRSRPMVILPIFSTNNHPILWEQATKWHNAWETSAHGGGLVPVVVPAGELDDIAVISTEEAMGGKSAAIKALIDKYQAGGAVVVILNGDLDKPAGQYIVDIQRYDADGNTLTPERISIPAPLSKSGVDATVAQAIKMARSAMEKDWRLEEKNPAVEAAMAGNNPTEAADEDHPTMRLPVVVPINTLAEWAQMRRKLLTIPGVVRADVITLVRGSTSIEIEFHGDIQSLQDSLMQSNLTLSQTANGGWVLISTANPL